MKKLNALIIGSESQLVIAMPALLNRAGFNVDAITSYSLLEKSKFISNFEHSFIPQDLMKIAAQKNLNDYDFIVICDDLTLENILNSDLSLEQKLQLLPVKNQENFTHLFSKIGLSKILSESGVTTPEFMVVSTIDEALLAAEKLQYPLRVNNDYPTKLILPYYLRLSALEILFNRYSVWKYLPLQDHGLLIKVMLVEVFKLNQIFRKIKRVPTFLIKLAVSHKEDRNKIKLKFKGAYRKATILFGIDPESSSG